MALIRRARTTFQRFVESEASGGLVLMASAALGMVVANSAFAGNYTELLHTKLAGLSVLHWINDGLMALFFLLVGLEIKREMLAGELDSWPRRALPLIAALGGMIVAGADLFRRQLADAGELAGLGDPDRHRYRLRARCAVAVRVENSELAESVLDLACDHG